MSAAGREVFAPRPMKDYGHTNGNGAAPKPSAKPTRKPAPPKSGERWADLNQFVDLTIGELTRAEIGTWMYLFRHARNGLVTASYDEIGKRIKTGPRNVRRAIRSLKKMKLLTVAKKGGLNIGANTYRISPLRAPAP
jgi:DNA-binding transcriptional ArsR family regulator